LVCGLLAWLVLEILSMSRSSATYDEPSHLAFGLGLLTGDDDNNWSQKMPITALNALPLWWRGAKATTLQVGEPLEWLPLRLPTLLLGVALLLAIFCWSWRLFGLDGALLSFGAALLCPNLAAHAALATTDVPCALAILLSCWALLHYWQRPSWSALLLVGTTIGFAQITKSTALLLIPLGGGMVLWRAVRPPQPAEGGPTSATGGARCATVSALARLGVLSLTMLFCLELAYGFRATREPLREYTAMYRRLMSPDAATVRSIERWSAPVAGLPIPLPHLFVETVINGFRANNTPETHGPIYLLGRLDRHGFWYYFPVVFLLKVPIPLLALTGLAGYFAIRRRHRTALYLFACTGLFGFFFTVGCTAQIGFRYLLPMMPLCYVALGVIPGSVDWSRLAAKGLLVVAFGWLLLSTMSYYPHWLSYLNEAVPDRTSLYRYCADSNLDWGQDQWYARRYLKRHPDVRLAPAQPTRGKLLVSVNDLVGVTAPRDRYRWLRDGYQPSATVAYSWLLFIVP
jgi:4-amino-4-deoxy-L-arabinose transferase-like glycosyltransferase